MQSNFTSVFFDLDGTLADTVPDLAAATNKMLIDRSLKPISLSELRPLASSGARGMIYRAFQLTPEDDQYENMRLEFLNNYEHAIHVHTTLFPCVEELLTTLENQNVPWGIVTNKHQRFTSVLMQSMGLDLRTKAIVSGDTTANAKPHPEPILYAAKLLNTDPSTSVYIGDDLRDIQAGRAAGMKTIAAAYGYCGNDEPAHDWQADFIAYQPKDLMTILFSQ